MVFCMAFGCSNASDRKGRKSKGLKNVSFHRLPLQNKDQLRKWIAAMKLEKPHINANSRVCSEHFVDEMFEDDSMKVRLFGAKPSRRLKPNAVPIKFVFSKELSQSSKRRQERQKSLAGKRWANKKKTIIVEDEDETSALSVPVDIEAGPSEECHCRHVVKVSTSTQTDTLADHLTIQHDHCYVKPIMTNVSKGSTRTKTLKGQSGRSIQKEMSAIAQPSELELSDIEHSDEDHSDVDHSDEDHSDVDHSDVDTDVESEYLPSGSESNSSEDNIKCNKDDVFLVYKSSLDQLFRTCHECNSLLEVSQRFRGSMVVYVWTCHNNHHGRWESQPTVRGMPKGNLDLAGSILFAGGTYQKVFDIAKTMHLNIFTERHFMNIQRSYLFPAIDSLYQEQHQMWLDAFRYQHVFLEGDGRSDSPGHNAKYLSYSLMEEDSEIILHFELVQVTEAPGQASTNMERVGFNRSMDYLLDEDILIDGVTSDRHPQISCDMKKSFPEIKHEYDIFHVAKNINKKIRKLASKKGCEALRSWIPSINNHFWWCCASCNGDYKELQDKWLSVLHHVCNIHEWSSGDRFYKCAHDPLPLDEVRSIIWLKTDSPPHKALQDVVLNKKLIKDMEKMALFKHTGSLEVFHGMLLKYCPKREHFSYEGMRARLQLAVLDHNENVGRDQATTDDGTLRFGLAFPKRKKQWVLKKVYQEKTYNFRQQLTEMVCARREDESVVLGERYVGRPDLPANIASSERPSKQDAIKAFRTRFKLS